MISYALNISHHLQVINPNSNYGIFKVGKPNEDPACTVAIPNQQPDCTCKLYADCGMPCMHILAVACRLNLDWCLLKKSLFRKNTIFSKYLDFYEKKIFPKKKVVCFINCFLFAKRPTIWHPIRFSNCYLHKNILNLILNTPLTDIFFYNHPKVLQTLTNWSMIALSWDLECHKLWRIFIIWLFWGLSSE